MTNEEFLKILPAYIGCKIKTVFGDIGTMNEFATQNEKGRCLITCWDLVQSYYYDDEIKLILRPLSEMTDEEYATITKKANGNPPTEDHAIIWGKELMNMWDSSRCNVAPMTWVGIINYLRSIGIDCDGLIESGFAITNTIEK